MLARIHKATEENEEGFTLIELLVVVIIIGILAAIAIPTFLNQREKAWASAAQSDLRNSAVVMESHFSEAGTYVLTAAPAITVADFKKSEGVSITVGTAETNAGGYCVQAVHAKLSTTTNTYVLRSSVGRPEMVKAAAGGNPAVLACS